MRDRAHGLLSFLLFFLPLTFYVKISASLAFADDPSCSAFRMDQGPDNGALEGSMVHVPVRNQGDFPICHAYAAASLIDAYRFSHDVTDHQSLSSPTDLAFAGLAYRPNSDMYDLSNNPSADIRGALSAGGTCTLSQLREERDYAGADRFIHGLDSLRSAAQSNSCRQDFEMERDSRYTIQVRQLLLESGFGSEVVPSSAIINAFLSATGRNLFQQYSTLVHSLCRGRVHPMPPFQLQEIEMDSISVPERVSRINAIFNQVPSGTARQPLGINYCSNVLLQPRSTLDYFDPKCERHISVIVGRRVQGGRCQFLVQNSWGPSCDPYPLGACEDGKIWLDAEALSRSIDVVTHLQ